MEVESLMGTTTDSLTQSYKTCIPWGQLISEKDIAD